MEVIKCPKCGAESGDDWSQCKGSCPMPGSPHYKPENEATCPRVMTKEQIIAGLRAGKVLCVDRRDAPELEDLFDLEKQGLVEQEFVVIDEQSSVVKWRWKA